MNRTRLVIASVIVTLICVYLAQPPAGDVGTVRMTDATGQKFDIPKEMEAKAVADGLKSMDWNAGYLALAFGASLPALWILGWALLRQTSRETSRVIKSWEK